MREIATGVFITERDLRFFGLQVGTRMTVLQLGDDLLLHSPIDMPAAELKHLGKPRWVVAPNKFHHLFVGPWIEAGLEAWAAPGLQKKRKDLAFRGVLETGSHPFGPDVELLALTCFSLSNEVVLFHKPSRTLLLTDLLFNFPTTAPLLTRAAMRCALAYPGCRASIIERIGMNRKAARQELAAIMDLSFERIVMAHGDVIEAEAQAVFAQAYRWLGDLV